MIRYCIRGHITTAHPVARFAPCFACGSRSAELLPDDETLPRRLDEIAHERDDTAREWESRKASDAQCADVYQQLAKRAREHGHELRARAADMRKRASERRVGGQSR